MRAVYPLIIFLFSVSFVCAADFDPRIDSIVNSHLDEEYNVGAVVGIVDKDSVDFRSYGVVKIGETSPPSKDTLFEIGSISKVFTGILLASLVEDGTVSLDDPISKFIPELPTTAFTSNITLLELSTHTSGLPSLPIPFEPANLLVPYADYSEEMMMSFLSTFQVGTHPTPFSWDNYSNLGVGLLGFILSRAAGISYEDLLKQRITTPLGMKDTVINLNEDQQTRFAVPYGGALDEVLPWGELGVFQGAGAIRSTATDLAVFLRANMNPDSTSIAAAINMAQQIHQSNAESMIGLGWGIRKIGNLTFYSHSGGTGGFRSNVAFIREKGKALLWLTNTGSGLQCIDAVALAGNDCTPDFGSSVSTDVLEKYVGKYKNTEFDVAVIITRRKNHLIYEIPGKETNILVALSDSKYVAGGVATFEFIIGTSGAATHFIATQNGQMTKLDKVIPDTNK